MAFQDDAREDELIRLFNLQKPPDASRGGIDAILRLDSTIIPFEVKSTSTDSVTTVRDFGPDHVKKWEGKHWLFGFYDKKGNLKYCKYGSPQLMNPWIEGKWDYVKLDFDLAALAASLINMQTLTTLLGHKDVYTYEDAKKLHKMQYSAKEYKKFMDVRNGYSPARMLEILRGRTKYLIERGSTLNNPHIPGGYFSAWEAITSNHAQRLRELVKVAHVEYLRLTAQDDKP